jgi:hypothetical protein
VVVSPGAWFKSLDIELPEGETTLVVKAVDTAGEIRILYREGSL